MERRKSMSAFTLKRALWYIPDAALLTLSIIDRDPWLFTVFALGVVLSIADVKNM